MSLLRIDCHPLGGVAGDMFAAALFDAYPHLYTDFLDDLSRLNIDGLSVKLEKQTSHSLYAQHFSVLQQTEVKPPRTLPAVAEFLDNTTIEPLVTQVAVAIYQRLAEAEAAVHGKTIDTVHFHEVSDWDSMVDILAAAGAIARLQCPQWRVGPLPLGGGTITTAHGDIPLPAPATVSLLKGFDWIDDGQPGERVTPTGAAIIAYLNPVKLQQNASAATLDAIGVGCGTRKLQDRANIFRISAFSSSEVGEVQTDQVTRLAFEVDDMTGEEISQAIENLRTAPGVLDASTVAMHGKKGRPSTGFRLLVKPDLSDAVTNECFRQTTTLGVRTSLVSRKILNRHSKSVDEYQVKVARRPGNVSTAKIESIEVSAVDTLQNRRGLALTVESKAIDD